jgi:hypothetical protein
VGREVRHGREIRAVNRRRFAAAQIDAIEHLAGGLIGPNAAALSDCAAADVDAADGDVVLVDVAQLQRAFTGSP